MGLRRERLQNAGAQTAGGAGRPDAGAGGFRTCSGGGAACGPRGLCGGGAVPSPRGPLPRSKAKAAASVFARKALVRWFKLNPPTPQRQTVWGRPLPGVPKLPLIPSPLLGFWVWNLWHFMSICALVSSFWSFGSPNTTVTRGMCLVSSSSGLGRNYRGSCSARPGHSPWGGASCLPTHLRCPSPSSPPHLPGLPTAHLFQIHTASPENVNLQNILSKW